MVTTMDRRALVTGGNADDLARVPGDDEFDGDFDAAPELERIGAALIAACPELAHLAGVNIGYLWKRKGGKKRGWCQKPSGLLRFYAESDFIIWVASDWARETRLTNYQLEALLFHEVSFADFDTDEQTGQTKPMLRPLEVEAWVAEIERYGGWSYDLGRVQEAFAQLPLFEQAGLRVAS